MDILGKLFGAEAKVKIMRLFLFNPESPFTNEDIAERTKSSLSSVRHELAILKKIKLIKSKGFVKRILKKTGKQSKFIRKRVRGWTLNPSFKYLGELQKLLIDASLITGTELLRKFTLAGKLKLVITSGIFLQDSDSRVDVLIVGDHLKRSTVDRVMDGIQAEIGKELRYAVLDTSEFNYRLGMYDKLVRDILDFPHTVILDRLGLPPMDGEGRKSV